MEANNSYGTSWADQWDYSNPDPVPENQKHNNGATANHKHKVGEGLGKTKTMAFNGAKKVKEGTSLGLQWMKDKYHQKTQKH